MEQKFLFRLTKETLRELPNLGDRHSALISSPDGTLIAGTTDTVTGVHERKDFSSCLLTDLLY